LAFEGADENADYLNIYRVLRLPPPVSDGTRPEWGKILTANQLEILDFYFRMVNIPLMAKMGPMTEEGVIDWNDFRINIENLHLSKVSVADNYVKGTVDYLNASETRTGFTVENVSARKVTVGEQQVLVEGVHAVNGKTDLYLSSFDMLGPIEDYSDFVDKIVIRATIAPGSHFAMPTIRYFTSGVEGITFDALVEGRGTGIVNNLRLEGIRIWDPDSDVKLTASGIIKDAAYPDQSALSIDVKELIFNLKGLGGFVQDWAPDTDLDLSQFAKGELFTFKGRVSGPFDNIGVKGDITSRIGGINADALIKNATDVKKPVVIGGQLEIQDLDLGRIANTSSLGPLSLKTGLEASFDKDRMQVRIDSLDIKRLQALNYDYTNISAAGTYREDAFEGRIVAADPNLNFLFQGVFNLSPKTKNAAYRFFASLGYADLHALHIDSREQSKISFQASSNLLRTEDHNLLGDAVITDILLENSTGRHNIGQLTVRGHANDEVSRIRVESDFLDGSYVGSAGPATFLNDLKDLVIERELPALLEHKPAKWNGATYRLALTVKDARQLFNFLVPGLYIEKNSTMNLDVAEDGGVTASLKSGRLAFKDKYIKDVKMSFDNANSSQTALITGKQISLSGAKIRDNRLTIFADDNQMGIGYTFDNGEDEETRAQIYFSGDLARDKEGLMVAARALPSNIYYKGSGWGLSSGEVTYHAGDLSIERLQARHDDETLLVNGGISKTKADTLSVLMDKFDISLLNTLSGSIPEIEGHATGSAMLISPSIPSSGLLASITCDSTYVAGKRMGKLVISSTWDEQAQRFNATLRNHLGGGSNIDADAYFKPSDKELHAEARLKKFDMGYVTPILAGLFADFGGELSGIAGFNYTGGKSHFYSKDLYASNGLIALDFTRVPYYFSGDLALTDDGLYFQKVKMNDGHNGSGTINGSLLFAGMPDFGMDLHIPFRDMKVLDIPQGVNSLLHGTATASGKVDIEGHVSKLNLNIDATTSGAGEVHVSLGGASGDSSMQMLTFTESPDDRETDPYEAMMAANAQENEVNSDMIANIRVRATPDLQVFLDVNEEMSLNARGTGSIEMETTVSQGSFAINGDYSISEGTFLFSAMNLVTRKFAIQDGSTIRFNGDVWDTDLNVRGLYATKASLANLIADETATSRRTVNCYIDISGRLSNPEVTFSIDVPDLNPTTQAQVDAALNSEDKVQKQFIYLLIAGNFLPGDDSGITQSGQDVLFSNVSSIMSGQLNNIFQKLNIPLDLGLNYQQTQLGSNIFDVALSTQLFNNRVLVNGTVGNKQQYGGTSTNEVAGDIEIEIKLNKIGSVRLKLFSHSADQYTSFLDNSQRNGAGFTYQRDFNSFLWLIRSIFSGRVSRDQQIQADIMQTTNVEKLEVDPNGKIVN
ncbi:MAG: translocation/assembly module TamB domain-containing protein, partial [Bacteroidales bacterium]|nr:translocation/assembly module TamB domain-containing protein [Bacteroidales bacterium]